MFPYWLYSTTVEERFAGLTPRTEPARVRQVSKEHLKTMDEQFSTHTSVFSLTWNNTGRNKCNQNKYRSNCELADE
jgi:hypothetical protein